MLKNACSWCAPPEALVDHGYYLPDERDRYEIRDESTDPDNCDACHGASGGVSDECDEHYSELIAVITVEINRKYRECGCGSGEMSFYDSTWLITLIPEKVQGKSIGVSQMEIPGSSSYQTFIKSIWPSARKPIWGGQLDSSFRSRRVQGWTLLAVRARRAL